MPMEGEPFTQPEARGRIRRIVASGLVLISDYTKSRMQERGVTMEDIRASYGSDRSSRPSGRTDPGATASRTGNDTA